MKQEKKTKKIEWEGLIIFLIFTFFLALAILLYVQDVPKNAFWQFCRLFFLWMSVTVALAAFLIGLCRHGTKNWNAYQQYMRDQCDAARRHSRNHDGNDETSTPDSPENRAGN